ncbi:MAG: hypothetical protein EXQ56_04160 [Acidobacteria bacterium]|nr:hypothetical protein [Acidobacteriota bacterium]
MQQITLGILMLFFLLSTAMGWCENVPPHSPQTVLDRMEQRYESQIAEIASYQALRRYEASNPVLAQPALRVLEEDYRSPETRTFHVVERRGPGYMDRLLFNRLMEVESETVRGAVRAQVDLCRRNYDFSFERYESATNLYLFRVLPRTAHPYLFRGSVWIDGNDFAVRRIEGSPAKRPSVWVRETHFVHEFGKFGKYWFPIHHHSEAQLRLFGTATLDISYNNYQWQTTPQSDGVKKADGIHLSRKGELP